MRFARSDLQRCAVIGFSVLSFELDVTSLRMSRKEEYRAMTLTEARKSYNGFFYMAFS